VHDEKFIKRSDFIRIDISRPGSACFQTVHAALAILEKIESEGGIIDIDTLTNAVTQATSRSDSLIFNFAFFLISLCWIIGIIDAYKTGKKKDNQEYRSN